MSFCYFSLMKSNKIFYVILFSLAVLLFVPNLLQKGMFVDGLWYAAIAHNLSEGLGSFWSPHFSKTMFPVFYDHPPLVFGIQSFFFRILGDSMYVEKIYAFFIICLSFLLIHNLWSILFKDNKQVKYLSFIPCLLWILHETTYMYYPNNLLECSQGLFILTSVIFILKGIRDENNLSYLYMFVAGISLILSFLAKGLTGLYPLITILLYYAIFRNISLKKMLIYHAIFLGSFSLIFALYFLSESAAENISTYLETQVMASLRGDRAENIQISRFYILRRFVETSLLPLVLVLIISIISYFRYATRKIFKFRKEVLFFMILALSGVLPMMVSEKQGTHYLVTVIPYISIALSLILIRSETIISKLRESKYFRILAFSLLLFSIVFPLFSVNKVNNRDRILLHDMEQFEEKLEKGSTMGFIGDQRDIALYGYFMRMHSISLDISKPYNYSLIVRDVDFPFDSSRCKPIDLKIEEYSILEIK
jgi:4-amino-4-deoxy-L-arabinose transferase-like glycosyltransferase